ncbi:dioxygenase [Mycobacterium sp. Y57]|nr:dioxygenase [Mycolicibacterium xanthum]MBX7435173.1 dioxygenase [Mycolicibacterium xanthum]
MGRNHTGHLEEHDRGLGYDLSTMSRRRVLVALGLGAAAAAAAGCGTTPAAGAELAEQAPQETQGPYPADGSNGPNVLIESGVVRSDITGSFGTYSGVAEGVPVTLTLTLQDLAKDGAPGAGMAVYLWHCDREGRYSLYSEGATEQNYLRGVQVADDSGVLTFTTIFPACYPGRWPHFHFEVFDSLETAVAGSDARLTSQIALPEESCSAVYAFDSGYAASIANLAAVTLDTDGVFGDGWSAELASVSGSPEEGLQVSLTVGVAEKSQNVMAGDGFGPPPGGAHRPTG